MKQSSRLIIIALAALAGPSLAADVGRVLLAAGDTVAVRGDQTVRLAFGAAVQDRDRLRTGPASNLQVRFSDESIVSLRENSELRIDEYRYAGREDGSERAFFSLLKGGLRVITGLIGRANNKNYRMSTTTATIGIRGTDYATRLCQKDCSYSDGTVARDGLYGRVLGPSHGTNRIDVANDADQKVFGMNENFFVADIKSRIESLLVPPDFVSNRLEGRKHGGSGSAGGSGSEQVASGGAAQDSRGAPAMPPPLEPLLFVSTESLGSGGTLAVLDGATSGSGNGGTLPGAGDGTLPGAGGGTIPGIGNGAIVYFVAGNPIAISPLTSANLTANSENQLTAFSMTGISGDVGTGTVVDTPASGPIAAAGNMTWGRWTGGTIQDVSTLTTTGLHYIVGDVPTLPGAGTFIYTPAGGTQPTNAAGTTGSFLGGTVTVEFFPGTLQLNDWQIGFNEAIYSQSGGGLVSPLTASFAGAMTWSCVGVTCGATGGILGQFSGSFFGTNAPGMGIVYLVQDNGNITGAQSFKR
jgi:hypothetical protein